MKKGTVKWYNGMKGYGFVTHEDKDYFLHATSITSEDDKITIKKGDTVEFELKEPTQPGKGKETTNVRIVR